jgi:hypothetical protein
VVLVSTRTSAGHGAAAGEKSKADSGADEWNQAIEFCFHGKRIRSIFAAAAIDHLFSEINDGLG